MKAFDLSPAATLFIQGKAYRGRTPARYIRQVGSKKSNYRIRAPEITIL